MIYLSFTLNSPIPVCFSSLIPKMLMFTLAISCLIISNVNWFMDLTFQVTMQYCSLYHWTLLPVPDLSTTEHHSCFNPTVSFFLELNNCPLLFPRSTLDTFWPGELIFQCQIFLPFHTVYGILEARILELLAIPFSIGPHFVWTLHYGLPILGGPAWHGS